MAGHKERKAAERLWQCIERIEALAAERGQVSQSMDEHKWLWIEHVASVIAEANGERQPTCFYDALGLLPPLASGARTS
jgi:hypothetical protein